MLFNSDSNVFNFSVDNYGSTFTDAGIGVNAPGHANANTKGAVGGDAPILVGKASVDNIYVRGTAALAPDTSMTCIAYGLGG